MVSCRRFAVQYCPLVMGKLNLMVDNSIVLFCKLHKEFLTDNFVLCSVFLGIPFIFVHVNSCPWRLQIWLVSAPVRCWSVSNCWCLSVTGIGGGSGDEGRGGDSASLCPRAAGHCWVSGDPPSPLCTSAEGEMGGSGEMETPVRPVSRAPPHTRSALPPKKQEKGGGNRAGATIAPSSALFPSFLHSLTNLASGQETGLGCCYSTDVGNDYVYVWTDWTLNKIEKKALKS